MLVEGEMVELGIVNGTGEGVEDIDEDVLMVDMEEKNDDEGAVDEYTVRQEGNGGSDEEDADADGEVEGRVSLEER